MNTIKLNGTLPRALMDPTMDLQHPDNGQKNKAALINRVKNLSQEERTAVMEGLNEIFGALREAQTTNLQGLNEILKRFPEKALSVLLLTDNGVVIEAAVGEGFFKAIGEGALGWVSSDTVVNAVAQVRLGLKAKGATEASYDYDAMRSDLFECLGKQQPEPAELSLEKKEQRAKLLSIEELKDPKYDAVYCAVIASKIRKDQWLRTEFSKTLVQIDKMVEGGSEGKAQWGQVVTSLVERPRLLTPKERNQLQNIGHKKENYAEEEQLFIANLVYLTAFRQSDLMLKEIEKEEKKIEEREAANLESRKSLNGNIKNRLKIAEKNRLIFGWSQVIEASQEKIKKNLSRMAELSYGQKTMDSLHALLITDKEVNFLETFSGALQEFIRMNESKSNKFEELFIHLRAVSNVLSSNPNRLEGVIASMNSNLGNYDKTYLIVDPHGIKSGLTEIFAKKDPVFSSMSKRKEFINCYFEAVKLSFDWQYMELETDNVDLQKSIAEITEKKNRLSNSELDSLPAPKVHRAQINPPGLEAPKQRIVVKYDAGFGNTICITGEGPQMNSWGAQIPLVKDPSDKDTWFYEIPEGAAKFDYKFTLQKKGVSAFEWEVKNGNYTRDPAQKGKIEHVIKFPNSKPNNK